MSEPAPLSRRVRPPLWLAQPTRFAALPRAAARLVVAALAVLLVACLTALVAPAPSDGGEGASQASDLMLCEGVIAGMRAGGSYYELLADALHAGDYPLRPFLTFRPPLHAVVQAALPEEVTVALLYLLAAGVVAAWWHHIRLVVVRPATRAIALFLLAGGMLAFVQPGLVAFHEIWAAQLIALALALRTPERWVVPAALALVAMLVRETAALLAVVMAFAAWQEGARREAVGWGVTLLIFALALSAHAWGVAQVVSPLDPASPGWSGLLGLGFFVRALAAATALQLLPLALAAVLVALALFGWSAWASPTGKRSVLTLGGYALAIALFARADTFYWGLMAAPVFLLGLLFVPDGVRDLADTLLARRRVRVRRITQ